VAFLHGLMDFVRFLCYLLFILIIARSVLSWFSPRPTNIVVIYLYKVTEPFLSPLRRIIPRTGMVDLSPLLAILILYAIIRLTYLAS
jgi:YggT family protein